MDYNTLKQLISDLGFSTDRIFPLLVLLIIMIILFNKRLKPLDDKITNIENFVLRLCSAIQSGGRLNKMELYTQKSPLTITPKGYEILNQSNFKNGIDNNINELIKIVSDKQPKTAYDVEQICSGIIRYVISNKDLQFFKDVENFLYKNPDYNIPEFFNLAGLYLRDKYLEKHPELLPKDN